MKIISLIQFAILPFTIYASVKNDSLKKLDEVLDQIEDVMDQMEKQNEDENVSYYYYYFNLYYNE